MNDLDHMLARLRDETLPGSLEAMGDPVMAGLAAGRARLATRAVETRTLALACGIAAVVGLWGGLSGLQSTDGARHQALLDLPAAAPSHLLAS